VEGAGAVASGANNSNFFGSPGNSAQMLIVQILGQNVGSNATAANNSNFGENAGYSATTANNSNFFGREAGYLATSAINSNFMGQNAGRNAINATQILLVVVLEISQQMHINQISW
jgi:hypothetical protein